MVGEVSSLVTCWKSHLGETIYQMSSSIDFLKNCISSKHEGRDGGIAAFDVISTHEVNLAVKLKVK